jgi:catechol 2,3-dioxygenase-like lactoylglutathione lyase family enzyme
MSPDCGPARRVLHVCYCCADADADAVSRAFADGLAMRETMTSPTQRQTQDLLGLGYEPTSGAAFLYDARGPRRSPAIEVQNWVDPPIIGTPSQHPATVGLHALGFAVGDLGESVRLLESLGCTRLGAGPSPFGSEWAALRDTNGVAIDLIADPSLPVGTSRLRHVRATVSDLAASMRWYAGLGFSGLETVGVEDGSFIGYSAKMRAEAVRLRLPDEPFEVLLMQWHSPRSSGRHYGQPNHAGLYRVALCVDDTRASHREMSAAGWTFDRPPVPVTLTGTPVPEMWICFLTDPDGIPYELVERPPSAFRT